MWQQGENSLMIGGSAISYCEGLSLGGHSDWRLPNIKELESLTDDYRFNPSIDTTFFPNAQDAQAYGYWSSTTYAGTPDYAWSVFFESGVVDFFRKGSGILYVRCVRGRQ